MRYLFLICLTACSSNNTSSTEEVNDAGKDVVVEASPLNPADICCYQTSSDSPDPMYQNKVWSCSDNPTFFVCNSPSQFYCDAPPCPAYDCTQCQFGWVCQTINGTGVIKACPK